MVKLFSKNSDLCDHNPPTSQTDGQTDRQTTCDRNTALCTEVHRAVKRKGKADDLYRGSMQCEDHRRTALQYPPCSLDPTIRRF